MKPIVRTLARSLAGFSVLLVLGCGGSRKDPEDLDRDGPMEDAGEAVDEAAEDTADATEDAVDDVGDAIDDDSTPPEAR